MPQYTPSQYAIGLVADPTNNPENPTFSQSEYALVNFIEGRGRAIGWFDNDKSEGWFVIDVKDPSLLEDLAKAPFVDQLPVPGDQPAMTQANGMTIQPPAYTH